MEENNLVRVNVFYEHSLHTYFIAKNEAINGHGIVGRNWLNVKIKDIPCLSPALAGINIKEIETALKEYRIAIYKPTFALSFK